MKTTHPIIAKLISIEETGEFLISYSNPELNIGVTATGKTKEEAEHNFESLMIGTCLIKTFLSIDDMVKSKIINLGEIEGMLSSHDLKNGNDILVYTK